ncbi:uncharacterized protein [Diadema setosum]|uniref:uncharacterized protein n=1 Tax=Diadema setosum TaxID=31175 RepID=UPI003B3A7164
MFIDTVGSRYYEMLPTGALQIFAGIPDEQMQGVYYCTIYHQYLGLIESRRAHVTIPTLGEITPPFGVTVYPSDTARFECNVTGTAPKVFTWQKDRQNIDLTEERYASRYTLLPSGALEIQDVRATDAGSYRCRVESPLLPNVRRRSTEAELVVKSDPPPAQRPVDLSFLVAPGPDKIEALLGDTLTLEAATTEPATLTWYKGDKQIVPQSPHYKLLGQGSLQITRLGEIDTGIYKVVATSTSDNSRVEKGVRVDVQVPPYFIERPQSNYVRKGKSFTFRCNVYGIPTSPIVWKREGAVIPNADEYVVGIRNLTIKDTVIEDSGMYQCTASNPWGNIQSTAQLIVVPDGVDIPQLPTTAQPPVLTQAPTLPSVSTTVAPQAPPTGPVPSQPLDVTARDVRPQSITVSWRPPLQTMGTLTWYRIYIRPENGRVRMVEVNKDSLVKTITDLLPNHRYEIYVVAENNNGLGEHSETIIVNTPDDTSNTPDPVSDIRVVPITSRSLEVSWRPPFDTHGPLTRYIIRGTDRMMGSTFEHEVDASQTSTILQDLDIFTLYELVIIPYNDNGPGGATSITARTPGAMPSAPPSNVSVHPTPSVPNALDISWVPPPLNKRNGEITQYKLRYRERGGEIVNIPIDGTETSYRLAGLERETDYEIKIAMVNVNGTGPFTDWHHGRTEAIVPNERVPPPAPAIIQVTPYAHQINMHWEHLEASVILVEGYLLGYGENIPDLTILHLEASKRYVELTDLDLNTNYVIRLRAFNKAGEGESVYANVRTSADSSNVPHVGIILRPSKENQRRCFSPMEVLADPQSSTEILLTWSDPNPINPKPGVERYYTVVYNSRTNESFKVNTTKPRLEVQDLKPFTFYDFYVMVGEEQKISGYSLVASAKTAAAVPDSAPQELTIRNFANTSTSVSVSWQPPLHSNGDIKRYILYYAPEGTTDNEDWRFQYVDGESLTTVLHDMMPNTVYTFHILAENKVGTGPVSAEVLHKTRAAGDVAYPIDDVATPWWLWLAIAAACLFLILLAIALLFCIVCGCCGCCADCCPGCASFCDEIYACCEPCGACLAGCAAGCCPCCCEDEEDCARCWTKCCCGVPCCVCCGKAYKERRAKAELTGYKAVANGKAISATNTTQVEGNPPDLWADELVMKSMGKNMVGTPSEMESLNKSEIESETQFSNHAQHQQATTGAKSQSFNVRFAEIHPINDIRVSERYIPVGSRAHESMQRSSERGVNYARVNKHEKPTVNINTTNVRIDEVKNEYQGHEGYSTLGSMQSESQGTRTRQDSDSQQSMLSFHNGQIVTFPDGTLTARSARSNPLTITFEETTTTHSVEKMVPQADGSNVKTVSSHQTFSKSYSTSDATNDRNLQAILRDGLDRGPLAIEVSTSSDPPLKAITAPTVSTLNDRANFNTKFSSSAEDSSMSTGFTQGSFDRGYNYNTMDDHREYNYNTVDSGVDVGRDYGYPSYGSSHNGLGHVENSSYEETQHMYFPDHSPASPLLGQSAISPSATSPTSDSPLTLGSSPPPIIPAAGSTFSREGGLSSSAMTLPTLNTRGLSADNGYGSSSNYHFRSTSNIDELHRGADPGFRARSSSTMSGAGPGARNKWYLGEGRSAFSPNRSEGLGIDRETSFANAVYTGSSSQVPRSDLPPSSGAPHASLSDHHHGNISIPVPNGSLQQGGGSSSYQSSSYSYQSHSNSGSKLEPTLSVPLAAPAGPALSGGEGGTGVSYDLGAAGLSGGGMGEAEHHSAHSARSVSASQYSTNNNNSTVEKGEGFSDDDREVASALGHAHSQQAFTGSFDNIQSPYLHPLSLPEPHPGLLRRAHSANILGQQERYYYYDDDNCSVADDDDVVSVMGLSEYDRRQARVMARVNRALKQRNYMSASSLAHGTAHQGFMNRGGIRYAPKALNIHLIVEKTYTEIRLKIELNNQKPLLYAYIFQHLNCSRCNHHIIIILHVDILYIFFSCSIFFTLSPASVTVYRGRSDNLVNTLSSQNYDYMSNASTRSAMSDRPPYVQYSSGYHSDTNASSQDESASQHSGGTAPRTNPLSSFSVPAPPAHYQHPQAKVRITAPTYSPLKRGQPGPPGRGRSQPMPVITPKAPDVTYRGVGDGNSPGSTVRTFSAEDLNAEMMHLEGLMKDLNAITQNELQN